MSLSLERKLRYKKLENEECTARLDRHSQHYGTVENAIVNKSPPPPRPKSSSIAIELLRNMIRNSASTEKKKKKAAKKEDLTNKRVQLNDRTEQARRNLQRMLNDIDAELEYVQHISEQFGLEIGDKD